MRPADAADTVPRLELTLAASAAGVGAGQQAVESFLQNHAVIARARARAALVLEEALMNVAMHGHDAPGEHRVGVVLRLLPDAIELRLDDDGRAFDPRTAPQPVQPASLAEARPGGLGVQLLRNFVRDLKYERLAGRNRLTLLLGLD